MSHGFGGVKEQDLPTFAEEFSSKLPVACLVYDNRCFGTSGGSPRQEIDPWRQFGDISDAVTFAQLQGEIDAERIGLWGSSYAGGSVLWVAAVDRRVKAVVSQVYVCQLGSIGLENETDVTRSPLSSGWETARFLARPEIAAETFKAFQHGMPRRIPHSVSTSLTSRRSTVTNARQPTHRNTHRFCRPSRCRSRARPGRLGLLPEVPRRWQKRELEERSHIAQRRIHRGKRGCRTHSSDRTNAVADGRCDARCDCIDGACTGGLWKSPGAEAAAHVHWRAF